MSIMNYPYSAIVLDAISAAGFKIEPGLSEPELSKLEIRFSFQFPPDLRSFLRSGLPVSKPFPDWRNGTDAILRRLLQRPIDDLVFDVETNDFWHTGWGPRPAIGDDAGAIAREMATKAPTLIPVFGHRFLPAEPAQAGNPVFSVSQADVIIYGDDLASYFAHEFGISQLPMPPTRPRPITFWSELAQI